MSCRISFALALAVLPCLALPGCGKDTLMETPAILALGLADPYKFTPQEFRTTTTPVFVAAPRMLSTDPDGPGDVYTNERSPLVRLGRATVEIGAGMTWDEVAAQSVAVERSQNPEVVLTAYEDYGTLWNSHPTPGFRFYRDYDFADVDRAASERWISEINERLGHSLRKQIYVYVHGFNTKFEKNTRICAEFLHYMARDGVMISFDWPSEGSVFSYQDDKANSEVAVRQFRNLLEALADESDASRINIIAHSAGTPIVVEALREVSLRHFDRPDDEARSSTKLGRVVLAAPDMDYWVAMSAGMDGVRRITDGIAVYASRRDRALGLSGRIFGDVRLGNVIGKLPPPVVQEMIRNEAGWVDVTAANERYPSLLGHSYYHQNPMVSSDIMLYLFVGATPEERGLVRDTETGFLIFPDDYEERLPDMLERLVATYQWRSGRGD